MSNLELGVIGNCTFGGLIDPKGKMVWAYLPRFDGDPIFCSLLNNGRVIPSLVNGERRTEETGFFDITIEIFAGSEQRYLHNTAILNTTLCDTGGAAVKTWPGLGLCHRSLE